MTCNDCMYEKMCFKRKEWEKCGGYIEQNPKTARVLFFADRLVQVKRLLQSVWLMIS